MLLLHCILQPLRRNRNEKPTIADAQYDFITLASTPNDIVPSIHALIKYYADKKQTSITAPNNSRGHRFFEYFGILCIL